MLQLSFVKKKKKKESIFLQYLISILYLHQYPIVMIVEVKIVRCMQSLSVLHCGENFFCCVCTILVAIA